MAVIYHCSEQCPIRPAKHGKDISVTIGGERPP